MKCPSNSWSFEPASHRCECSAKFYRDNELDASSDCKIFPEIDSSALDFIFVNKFNEINVNLVNASDNLKLKCFKCDDKSELPDENEIFADSCNKNSQNMCNLKSIRDPKVYNFNSMINIKEKFIFETSQKLNDKVFANSTMLVSVNKIEKSSLQNVTCFREDNKCQKIGLKINNPYLSEFSYEVKVYSLLKRRINYRLFYTTDLKNQNEVSFEVCEDNLNELRVQLQVKDLRRLSLFYFDLQADEICSEKTADLLLNALASMPITIQKPLNSNETAFSRNVFAERGLSGDSPIKVQIIVPAVLGSLLVVSLICVALFIRR